MEQLLETFILRINITIHEDSPIDKLDSSLYNGQSMVSTCGVVCVDNGRFFYFKEGGKLDIHVLVKKRYPVIKNASVLFFECTEIHWKTSDINGSCISIFLDNMG